MKPSEDKKPLSDEEIEAILEREAAGLPSESHLPAQPLTLATREPGQWRFGTWAVWLIIAFLLLGALQAMR